MGLSPLVWPCLSTAPGVLFWVMAFFKFTLCKEGVAMVRKGAVPVLPPCADSNLGTSRDGIAMEFIYSTFSLSYLIVF